MTNDFWRELTSPAVGLAWPPSKERRFRERLVLNLPKMARLPHSSSVSLLENFSASMEKISRKFELIVSQAAAIPDGHCLMSGT